MLDHAFAVMRSAGGRDMQCRPAQGLFAVREGPDLSCHMWAGQTDRGHDEACPECDRSMPPSGEPGVEPGTLAIRGWGGSASAQTAAHYGTEYCAIVINQLQPRKRHEAALRP